MEGSTRCLGTLYLQDKLDRLEAGTELARGIEYSVWNNFVEAALR